MWRACLAIPLAACGGTTSAPTIANHGAATPFGQAELAVRDGGELRLYALPGDRMTEVMKVHLADNVDGSFLAMNPHDFNWADRDHLVAAMGEHVVIVSAAGTKELAVPSADSIQAPKPALHPGDPDGEPGGGVFGLTIADGSAWWSKCTWGFAADGFQCTQYVHVRLWPSAKQEVAPDPIVPRGEWQWPTAAPSGYKTAPAEDSKSVACTAPSGAPATLRSSDDADMVAGIHWISLSPPRLLVEYGGFGMTAFMTRWALHDGCNATPIETGSYAHAGPDGLWVAEGDKATTLRRGAKVLGELPSGDVRFR
jgi:hypothetical protein